MNKLTKITILVFFLLILSNTVLALGISPTKINVDFEPNKEETVSIRIINNERKELRTTIYAEGPLKEIVNFNQNIMEISKEEEIKSFNFNIDFPAKIDPPGTHEVKIIVLELPDQFAAPGQNTIITEQGPVILPSTGGDTLITATVAVVSRLQIHVPFPGKFITADMTIQEAEADKPVRFTIPISNFGTSDLNKVSARIKILTTANEELAEIQTNEISLKSKEKQKITASWDAQIPPGTYIAKAIIDYDGDIISIEQQFSVGSKLIEIEDVIVNDFILGGVARFDIIVESFWNEIIKDVFAEMIITDKQGNEMTRFKSAVTDVNPLSKTNIQSFWDTQGVQVGLYDVNLIVNYAGKTAEKTMEIQVNIDSISTDLASGAVVAERGIISRDTVLILTVILLIIINVGWFIYMRKRRKKE